jgi:hypothetical protein
VLDELDGEITQQGAAMARCPAEVFGLVSVTHDDGWLKR